MPTVRNTNFDYAVKFKCVCLEELEAGFYDEGRDEWYVDCPECKEVYVVAKPFVASLKGLAEEAKYTLNALKGIEDTTEG